MAAMTKDIIERMGNCKTTGSVLCTTTTTSAAVHGSRMGIQWKPLFLNHICYFVNRFFLFFSTASQFFPSCNDNTHSRVCTKEPENEKGKIVFTYVTYLNWTEYAQRRPVNIVRTAIVIETIRGQRERKRDSGFTGHSSISRLILSADGCFFVDLVSIRFPLDITLVRVHSMDVWFIKTTMLLLSSNEKLSAFTVAMESNLLDYCMRDMWFQWPRTFFFHKIEHISSHKQKNTAGKLCLHKLNTCWLCAHAHTSTNTQRKYNKNWRYFLYSFLIRLVVSFYSFLIWSVCLIALVKLCVSFRFAECPDKTHHICMRNNVTSEN